MVDAHVYQDIALLWSAKQVVDVEGYKHSAPLEPEHRFAALLVGLRW
jgi:hypothetical protein